MRTFFPGHFHDLSLRYFLTYRVVIQFSSHSFHNFLGSTLKNFCNLIHCSLKIKQKSLIIFFFIIFLNFAPNLVLDRTKNFTEPPNRTEPWKKIQNRTEPYRTVDRTSTELKNLLCLKMWYFLLVFLFVKIILVVTSTRHGIVSFKSNILQNSNFL